MHDDTIFVALNATPGTGIAQAVEAAFDATKALLNVYNANTEQGANSKLIEILSLRLIVTVVPASATRAEFLASIDTANRRSSGGTQLTGKPAQSVSTKTSNATIYAGALVTAAESANVKRIARGQLSTSIPIAFEEFFYQFGAPAGPAGQGIAGTTGRQIVQNLPRCVLFPGHSFTLHQWYPSNSVTPASYEVELRYREKIGLCKLP